MIVSFSAQPLSRKVFSVLFINQYMLFFINFFTRYIKLNLILLKILLNLMWNVDVAFSYAHLNCPAVRTLFGNIYRDKIFRPYEFFHVFCDTLKSLIEEQIGINEQAWKKVPPCLLIY